MAPLTPTGFWSYSSRDDLTSSGRLSLFRRLLADHLQGQVGRAEVRIFQDVAAIPPGTEWERQIDKALEQSSFFIPIITPGFLQSEWCCEEVVRFHAIMERRGRSDLIVPIHYLDVNAFDTVRRAECFDARVLTYLRTLQWIDFRPLRLRDPTSEDVHRALDQVAAGILSALYRESPPPRPVAVPPERPVVQAEPPPPGSGTAPPPRGQPPPSSLSKPVSIRSWKRPAIWGATGLVVLLAGYFIQQRVSPRPPPVQEASSSVEPPAPIVAPPPQPVVVPPPAPPKEFRDNCPSDAICPEMVLIPRGIFQMGTTDEELVRENVPESWGATEKPRHPVFIAADFYLGKYAVTVGEFKVFARAKGARSSGGCFTWEKSGTGDKTGWQFGADRTWETPGFSQTDRDPVVCVSYEDALSYINWLNTVTRTKLYRLPSEAEWEYAARAGTAAARFWGDGRDSACGYANVADRALAKNLASPAPENYFACDDGFAFTSPVGKFQPNAFGLYDMLGNVWQWTGDCWNKDYKDVPLLGSVRTTGNCSRRVVRGGSWDNDPRSVRAGSRNSYNTGDPSDDTGFRVARTL